MKQSFLNYGSILLLDSTYNITSNDCFRNWKFFTIVTLDGLAQAKPIACISVVNETLFTLRNVFNHLKIIFDLSKVTTVMTDKDFSERKIISEYMYNASSLLCSFHVKKSLQNSYKKKNKKLT